jgi:transposase, IS5 family
MAGFPGLFEVDERLKRLNDLGDQLLGFAGAVDFEIFRADLDKVLGYSDGAQGGRPPFDAVLMFKILVIQAANNLSDERAEFLINDRLSFMRFLGLGLSDRVPDARTIWLFREKITRAGAIKTLFDRFDASLRAAGYIAMSGQIVDASLISAPKQRSTQEEKRAIKEGRIPEEWTKRPAKLAHKDRDARWTVKFTKAKVLEDGSKPAVDLAIPTFGYKNHVSIDKEFGLIRAWLATDAAAYDSARLREGLLDKTNTASAVWPIPAIARRPTRTSWPRTAWSPRSTAKSPRAVRCPTSRGAPTRSNRKCARASSTCSPSRRIGWTCSSAPSASPGPRRRSGWPTSSIISSGRCSCGGPRPLEGERRRDP